jgi:hypothetical protein
MAWKFELRSRKGGIEQGKRATEKRGLIWTLTMHAFV